MIGFKLNQVGLLLVILPVSNLLSIAIIICMILLEPTIISNFLTKWLNWICSSEIIYLTLHNFIISLIHAVLISYTSLLTSVLRTYYSTIIVEPVLLTYEVWVILKSLYFQFIFNLRSTKHSCFHLVLRLLVVCHILLLSKSLLFLQ